MESILSCRRFLGMRLSKDKILLTRTYNVNKRMLDFWLQIRQALPNEGKSRDSFSNRSRNRRWHYFTAIRTSQKKHVLALDGSFLGHRHTAKQLRSSP